jgi:uncharacterized protein (DUF433 family)
MIMQRHDIIISDPEVLAGEPVFKGTRVPVQNLLDYLRGGETVDGFLDDFPSVRREQVEGALDLAGEALSASAPPS